MKKVVLLTAVSLVCISVCFSQSREYDKAIGARLGYPFALTYKQFINEEDHAIEGIIGYRSNQGYNWFNVGAAYQIHKPLEINGVDGLMWYYGAGASAYFWSYNRFYESFNYSRTSFGIQGYIGLDYKFEKSPINVSLDWVPSLFLNGFGSGFSANYGSLVVRYTFGNS